jgi:hypothetical protein
MLQVKVRRVYNKRKLGQRYQLELKRLSKEMLAAKDYLKKCWQKKKCTGDIFAVSTMK